MSGVSHDVQVEPHHQLLSGELLRYKFAVHEDDARVDIRAASFGCHHHHSFLMLTLLLRVTSLLVQLQLSGDMKVINVELIRSVFVKWKGAALQLLCSSLQGTQNGLPQLFIDALPPFLVRVEFSPYSVIMGWPHCSLGFFLFHSSLMCLHGSR